MWASTESEPQVLQNVVQTIAGQSTLCCPLALTGRKRCVPVAALNHRLFTRCLRRYAAREMGECARLMGCMRLYSAPGVKRNSYRTRR